MMLIDGKAFEAMRNANQMDLHEATISGDKFGIAYNRMVKQVLDDVAAMRMYPDECRGVKRAEVIEDEMFCAPSLEDIGIEALEVV